MHRILLCDDEGMVREGLKFIINKEFGNDFLVEEAKSGRIAIEMTNTFRPDIILMDIQMPGISGIEAIREIKKEHKNIIFIILTAYDRFSYAKEAIYIGALDYLTKPINKEKVVAVIKAAIKKIDEYRTKVSREMEVLEKLEAVTPIIENGFVSGIFQQDYNIEELIQYKEFLGIEDEYGYMLMIKYGDDNKGGVLTNPVGARVKGQKSRVGIQETIKEFFPGSLATIMGNRAVVFNPVKEEMDYEDRVSCIERSREMVRKLEKQFEMSFQVGIGDVTPFSHLYDSYKEATKACRSGAGKVIHILDIPAHLEYGEGYPIETERAIFENLEKGDTDQVLGQVESFMMWLKGNRKKPENNHKLKVLEMVLLSEQKAYLNGGMTYNFSEREGYLESILECDTFEELGAWFDEKMAEASNNIANRQHEYYSSLIKQAIEYIQENFTKELTLDEVSKKINISPYYFSKIFKEETGTNFVEFFTKLRIDYACELLKGKSHSIKEICGLVGYSDPNYFSRIFKKWTNDTPTEYREREGSQCKHSRYLL